MQRILNGLGVLMMVGAVLCMAWYLAGWWRHPERSQMEQFQSGWRLWLSGMGLGLVGQWLTFRERRP